jgi:hypothetical protein
VLWADAASELGVHQLAHHHQADVGTEAGRTFLRGRGHISLRHGRLQREPGEAGPLARPTVTTGTFLFTVVPFLVGSLGGHPTPTSRQVSGADHCLTSRHWRTTSRGNHPRGSLDMNPFQAAPPLVRLSANPSRYDWLVGSSFLVPAAAGETFVVTAAHVLDDGRGDGGVLGFPIDPPPGVSRMPLVAVAKWHVRQDLDLAVGRHEQLGLEGFRVHTGALVVNRDVMTIEHSGGFRPSSDETGTSSVAPLLRKGNVVQAQVGLHPRHPTVRMLELSYPALKGASGSPVLDESGQEVLGVVVANRERELMPAQVLTTVSSDGAPIEEVRYFLPNALAVAYDHLADIISEAETRLGY